MIPPIRSILIIGAGAAGLAAARELTRAGRPVTVLEARDRIGGRVFTLPQTNAAASIELGAEFVHGKSPALWALARAANLKIHEAGERYWYFDHGKLTKSRDFWRSVQRLMDQMKSFGPDLSFREFLNSLPDDEKTRRAKDMAMRYVEGFHAGRIDRIGIHGLIKANGAAESVEGNQSYRFEDGYDKLMQALRAEAESRGAVFHLQTIVKEIHWQKDEIEVRCDSGKPTIYTGSAALITLPLGVLQIDAQAGGLSFRPALPDAKQAAIQHLAMGNVIKLNLVFRERFWEDVKLWDEHGDVVSFRDAGFFHYPDAPIPTWWTQLPIRAPLLVGWAGGPRADQLRNEGALLNQAINSLSLIFNASSSEIRSQLESSHIHDWHDDPFSRGAYSYVPVNALSAQETLAQPLENKLFFAGEATSIGHIGTVHGAIQSGQRAAGEILRR